MKLMHCLVLFARAKTCGWLCRRFQRKPNTITELDGQSINCPLNCHLYIHESVHRRISVQRLTVNQRAQRMRLECSALKETAMSPRPQSQESSERGGKTVRARGARRLQRNSTCWTRQHRWTRQHHCPRTHRSCDCVYDIYTRPHLPKSKHRWEKSHGVLPLAEELLATDGCWGRRVLVSFLQRHSPQEATHVPNTHAHTGSTKQTLGVEEKEHMRLGRKVVGERTGENRNGGRSDLKTLHKDWRMPTPKDPQALVTWSEDPASCFLLILQTKCD